MVSVSVVQLAISDAAALRLPDQRTRKQKRQQRFSSAQPASAQSADQPAAADAQIGAGAVADSQQRQVG